jgi:hypothetical protein
LENVPGSQGIHLEALGKDMNCPAGQREHDEEPEIFEKLPGEQEEQPSDPSREKEPTQQSSQTVAPEEAA